MEEVIRKDDLSRPFNFEAFGTHKYRIPCLTTLENGNLLAVSDVRASGLDSPDNIEIGVRVLDKNTNEWSEPIIAMEFDDFERGAASEASASYIDSAIVQVEGGRIFMLSDAMPSYTGGGTGTGYNGMVSVGGKHYYALTAGDATLPEGYDYYLFPNPDSKGESDKYIIKNVSDSSDTEYTADGKMCLYKNGERLFVKQQPNEEIDVPMSIFYDRADLQLYHTAYWALSYSDDGGYTWSDPVLVGSGYRGADENFYNKSPGLGYQVKKGAYKGRIIFPIYAGYDFFDLSVAMLYSDDGGATWSLGEKIAMSKEVEVDGEGNERSLDPVFASETQLIELPDGTLRVFSRTGSRYIGYADSLDGGVTFEPLRNDFGLEYCYDCMVSVINYSQRIDGREAVVISYPKRRGRYDGRIRIGLIRENEGFDAPAYNRYTIEWRYKYEINEGVFWYSCLAELENYGLAYLYEPGTSIIYDEVAIKDFKKNE